MSLGATDKGKERNRVRRQGERHRRRQKQERFIGDLNPTMIEIIARHIFAARVT